MIRQPIVVVMGHVDHGKTTLLDGIRKSTVAAKEAGLITQHIGATEVPLDSIKRMCTDLLDAEKIKIPGLLFLDTPGHEAFTTLRKRGSSIADLAILIIDIKEGIMPQTEESITLLKEYKTPFLVAANKIDKLGWKSHGSFRQSMEIQPREIMESVDNAIYTLMGKLSERGFDADRFDRVRDFRKTVAIVPVSGMLGFGIPELVAMLVGLSQQFLKDELDVEQGMGKGSILEVKEVKGLGVAVDAILYDGSIKEGDYLVIGGENPVVTNIRSLLKPPPLGEMRVEKKFERVKIVNAASGVKISATGLENAIAGMPFRATSDKQLLGKLTEELREQVTEAEIEETTDGTTIKADTLGSLEAIVKILKAKGVPIKRARIGSVTRKDVMEIKSMPEDKRIIFAFNVPVLKDAEVEAKGDVKMFNSSIIYELLEEYEKWIGNWEEERDKAALENVIRPGKVRFLSGYVFRQRKPAIIGVEVENGIIRTGYSMMKDGKTIGRIVDIQKEGKSVGEAKRGEQVALSIEGPTVGRQINEGDVLFNRIGDEDRRKLGGLKKSLKNGEADVLEELDKMGY